MWSHSTGLCTAICRCRWMPYRRVLYGVLALSGENYCALPEVEACMKAREAVWGCALYGVYCLLQIEHRNREFGTRSEHKCNLRFSCDSVVLFGYKLGEGLVFRPKTPTKCTYKIKKPVQLQNLGRIICTDLRVHPQFLTSLRHIFLLRHLRTSSVPILSSVA